jgi:hypothetical protein
VARNVLILGCGRSGTSIFGELFAAIPSFEYLEEPYAADVPNHCDRAIAVKVPRHGANLYAPPGCALTDELLARIPPEPRTVFWQVRHPYDAVCSLRTGIADGWGHHPRPPDWQEWKRRPLIEQCAHHWATINTFGYQQVANIAVVNRFEDMIRDPLTTAQRTANAVDIDPSQIQDALAAWAYRVRDKNDDQFVEARMSRHRSQPDHVRRVGRWRENLSPQEREQIRPIVAEAAGNLGYSLHT